MKRKFNLNDYYFDVIDTECKAYFLGLMTADGTNYVNGSLKIDLVESDSYILKKFASEIEYEGTVKYYPPEVKKINGKLYECKGQCRLLFKSRHMSEHLNELGCIHHKSVNEHHFSKAVPETLFNHYLRGYFDGNGCISYHDTKYNTDTKKFALSFCGQEDFIMDISKFIGEKFGCHPTVNSRYKRDNHNSQVEVCGNLLIHKIMSWLYSDATVYLDRKYEKYVFLGQMNEKVHTSPKLYGSCHLRRSVVYLPTLKIYASLADAERDTGIKRPKICVDCKGAKNQFMYTEEFKGEQN